MRARENVAAHSRGDMFTQILRRARKNVAVHSEGGMFTHFAQRARENVALLSREYIFTQFLQEHAKLLLHFRPNGRPRGLWLRKAPLLVQ